MIVCSEVGRVWGQWVQFVFSPLGAAPVYTQEPVRLKSERKHEDHFRREEKTSCELISASMITVSNSEINDLWPQEKVSCGDKLLFRHRWLHIKMLLNVPWQFGSSECTIWALWSLQVHIQVNVTVFLILSVTMALACLLRVESSFQ